MNIRQLIGSSTIFISLLFFFLPSSTEARSPVSKTVSVETSGVEDPNDLLNSLIAFWLGNEANGNLIDVHVNGLDLEDVGTVTSNPGLVYSTARQYTSANSEYHTYQIENPLLEGGAKDFTFATWVYLDSRPDSGPIIAKWYDKEYILAYNGQVNQTFMFVVGDGGAGFAGYVFTNSFGTPELSTWYLIIAWLDYSERTVNVQVNNGPVESASLIGEPGISNEIFQIGKQNVSGGWYFDGRIGPTMFWKSDPGGGGVLTSSQRSLLWNDGLGLTYELFDEVTPPDITVNEYLPDPTSDTTPSITGSAIDSISAIVSVEYQADSGLGQWADCTADDGAFDELSEEFTCDISPPLPDGIHTIYIRATDTYENTTPGEDYLTDTFEVDTSPPTFPIVGIGALVDIEPGISVTVDTPRPPFVGITEPDAHVTVTIYSDPIVCETDADESGNWECTLGEDIPEGTHRVVVEVVDLAGNEYEGEFTLVVGLADTGTGALDGFLVGILLLATVYLYAPPGRRLMQRSYTNEGYALKRAPNISLR